MACYKDKCFCSFHIDCFHGDVCGRSLTKEVEKAAAKAGLPIDRFTEKPQCFKGHRLLKEK